MCGILGIIIKPQALKHSVRLQRQIAELLSISESRGKEASGVSVLTPSELRILKSPLPASRLVKSRAFQTIFASKNDMVPVAAIAHTRLVTNGGLEVGANNQPVITNGIVGIHNGIVVNDVKLWKENPDLIRTAEVDTEVLFALLRKQLHLGSTLVDATRKTFAALEGTASIAAFFKERDEILLSSNNGSLYYVVSDEEIVFASEYGFLKRFAETREGTTLFGKPIVHIRALQGILIDITTGEVKKFSLNDKEVIPELPIRTVLRLLKEIPFDFTYSNQSSSSVILDKEKISQQFKKARERIARLTRCTRCILPATMPFITFDTAGVCNYCTNYTPASYLGLDELQKIISQYRKGDGTPDTIVGFSGGRDSSFTLHVAKETFGLTPLAYTYDWGMITDLGRRNQARLCGKLGVEHILISADIKKKRHYIARNIEAWLKRPELGTIPLFMAGDKQYFHYLNKLRRETGVKFVLYSENPLEKTNFKTGFCGLPPNFATTHDFAYNIGIFRKLHLFFYYAKAFILNPSYLNASLIDTVLAFLSSYFISHDYTYIFNYIPWNEEEIEQLLRKEYDWELSPDTQTTWRIGDGTAAFYNLIYYIVAGFTENDTFRSNQIREGVLTRDEALRLVLRDNVARISSLQWYFDTLGLDGNKTLEVIFRMPRRYTEDGRVAV